MSLSRRDFIRGAGAAGLALPMTAGLASPAQAQGATAQTVDQVGTITILHTNDTHSRMEPFHKGSGRYAGHGGVARRASLIKAVRAAQPNTLVLDGGDFFQGTPYFNRFHGALEVKALSALGYDAVTIGNHDFDLGPDGLAAALEHKRFSVVSSNYKISHPQLAPHVQPYLVKNFGPIKVGVFGLGVALDGLVNPRLSQGVVYQDPIMAAQEAVEVLRVDHGVHMVVALSHLGFRGVLGEPGDLDWPRQVKGVNYVVGGHTHTFLDAPRSISHARGGWETLVMQVGFAGINLGRADFDVRHGTPRLRYSRVMGVAADTIV